MRYTRMGLARQKFSLNLNLLQFLSPKPLNRASPDGGFEAIILHITVWSSTEELVFWCILCIHCNRCSNFWNTACVERWIVTWLLVLNSYFVCIPARVITRSVFWCNYDNCRTTWRLPNHILSSPLTDLMHIIFFVSKWISTCSIFLIQAWFGRFRSLLCRSSIASWIPRWGWTWTGAHFSVFTFTVLLMFDLLSSNSWWCKGRQLLADLYQVSSHLPSCREG